MPDPYHLVATGAVAVVAAGAAAHTVAVVAAGAVAEKKKTTPTTRIKSMELEAPVRATPAAPPQALR